MKKLVHNLPRLLVVSSGNEHGDQRGRAIRQAAALAETAPVLFHLREKGLDSRRLLALAIAIRQQLADSGSRLVVNERLDIALAGGADGVHLPESSCPPDAIAKAASGLVVGRSVHSEGAAVDAWKAGVDYLVFGPVFATPSKASFGPPQGLDALSSLCSATPLPVYAVGGLTPANAFACIEAGAHGIAALRAFSDVDAIPVSVNAFLSTLDT